MAAERRIKILTEAEIAELFSPPVLNLHDQRFFFALNDAELAESKRIRERDQRCMFVVLLGYFKVKPIIPAISTATHTLFDLVLPQLLPKAKAGILTSLIGVKHHAFGTASLNESHFQSTQNQVCIRVIR